jgi:hypothetical protein
LKVIIKCKTMALPFQATLPFSAEPRRRWQGLEPASKLFVVACLVVVCGAIYASTVVASHIEAAFAQKAAATTALYMDSAVEPLVQELAAKPSLSSENRRALERLLSSLSLGKTIVAFSIWIGDDIVFGSPQNLAGRSPPADIKDRALRGEVVANFSADTVDPTLARHGHVPVLEVYAPIRQTGSSRVIALASTSELAVALTRETRAAQYASYVVIASAAIALVVVLFNLTRRLQTRIGELSQQRMADEQFRQRLCEANGRVFESNERNLRRVGKELHAGPLQLAALALLKVDALAQPPGQVSQISAQRANDIEAMRKALTQCLRQIRALSASLAPSELADLSFAETLGTAICLHELRTATPVACDFGDLPTSAPDAVKACAYQFVSQGLTRASQQSAGGAVHIRATGRENLEIELCYEVERSKRLPRLAEEFEHEHLRRHIEALGGKLLVRAEAERLLRITARFGAGSPEDTRAVAVPAA